MQTPANFIRLLSLSFLASIETNRGVSARTCEVKDGFLIIPVVDTDEALSIVGKLGGELPIAEAPQDNSAKKDPLEALGKTAEKLRAVADAIDAPKHQNGAATKAAIDKTFNTPVGKGFFEPAITEQPPARELKDDESLFKKPNGTTAPAVNAPPMTDEPTTSVRAKPAEKPKPEKKPTTKAEKPAPARNIVDDVAAQEATAAPEPPPTSTAPVEEVAEPENVAHLEEPAAQVLASRFDEALISTAPRLRDIVVHFYERGLTRIPDIIGELAKRKDNPLVGKAVIPEERIARLLDAAGFAVSA